MHNLGPTRMFSLVIEHTQFLQNCLQFWGISITCEKNQFILITVPTHFIIIQYHEATILLLQLVPKRVNLAPKSVYDLDLRLAGSIQSVQLAEMYKLITDQN